ncbi:SNARE protein [Plasmodium inui San Antonio 1]|uniref:SNARE protein n=1 Tax=Plasmodium inui San Antonio 1 TaxID=1237626 RepID=W7AKW5_9APIC|nr:SNARE protein [Plasmodium inui San Antonio 1]EUD69439.1 SNARE protein [Plasmodium inui San Antonio 1]
MGDIFFYMDEIDNLLEDYRKLLIDLKKESERNDEKTTKKCLDDIHFLNERIKTAKDANFIEMRNLPEEEQHTYILKIKGKMAILEDLNIQFDFLKSKILYAQKEANRMKEQNRVKYVTPKDIKNRGDFIQDQTEESIFRMKMMVNESEQITRDAAVKLNEQNEKLRKVKDKVEDVDTNVSSAKETLKEIAKEAVTDRFVRFLSLLIFIVLIILITVISISKKK